MASDTMTKTGGWRVELQVPVSHNGKTIDAIDIRPMRLDDVLLWGDDAIASTLGLLETLSGVPEEALRQLQYPDVDRVLTALASLMAPPVRDDFQNGRKPLATPSISTVRNFDTLDPETEEIPPDPPPEDQLGFENDPVDPRFPKSSGPVKRFEQEPPKQADEGDAGVLPMRSVGQRIG